MGEIYPVHIPDRGKVLHRLVGHTLQQQIPGNVDTTKQSEGQETGFVDENFMCEFYTFIKPKRV